MNKTLRGLVAAGLILCATPLPAYADFVARDGNNNKFTKASKNANGAEHDQVVVEGLDSSTGSPRAGTIDASTGGFNVNIVGGGGGGGGGGAVTAASGAYATGSIVDLGALSSPAAGTVNYRLNQILTALGSPFQAGGSIGNTAFGATQSGTWNITNISGTISLPTLAATSTKQSDGSQKTQIVDGSGNVIASTSNNLNVQCANCSGSGVSAADGATMTPGTSLFAGAGGFYQTTATSNPLTTGKQGFMQLTQYRALMVNPRDSSGVEIVPATAANQTSVIGTKAAGTAASNSLLAGGVYNSAGITLTNGQQAALQFTSTGALVVTGGGGAVTAASGAFASGSISNGADVVEGTQTDTTCSTTHTISGCLYAAANNTGVVKGAGTAGTADSGVLTVQGIASMTPLSVSINQGTPGTTNGTQDASTGSTGSAVPSKAAYVGANSSGNLTGIIQADASAPINVSTATTTQLVALSSGKKIYVTSLDVIAGGTGNITFEYGTGSNCGTGTTVLTGAYNLTAQAGIAKGNGLGAVLVVPASNALCVLTSAAVQMSGSVAYTQF